MSKRGRTSTMFNDVHAPKQALRLPRSETGMSTSVLMLTRIICHLWSTRIEVSLEAHDLWGKLQEGLSCIVDDPKFHLRVTKQSSRHQEECKRELGGSSHILCGNGQSDASFEEGIWNNFHEEECKSGWLLKLFCSNCYKFERLGGNYWWVWCYFKTHQVSP